jgi:hypothetical protein
MKYPPLSTMQKKIRKKVAKLAGRTHAVSDGKLEKGTYCYLPIYQYSALPILTNKDKC